MALFPMVTGGGTAISPNKVADVPENSSSAVSSTTVNITLTKSHANYVYFSTYGLSRSYRASGTSVENLYSTSQVGGGCIFSISGAVGSIVSVTLNASPESRFGGIIVEL